MKNDVLELRQEGIFCPSGGFFIDPRGKVERAVITHAHSDHGRPGHGSYLCSETCKNLLKLRIGGDALIESLPFGEKIKIGEAFVSFHPAGHILGSAQIRVEVNGQVWVVSGDYKPQADQTCEPFELVKCHGYVSECTFGLPVYRWLPEQTIHHEINTIDKRSYEVSTLTSKKLNKKLNFNELTDKSIIETFQKIKKDKKPFSQKKITLSVYKNFLRKKYL